MHDVVTDWSLISCFHAFLWFPWPILAIFHIANVFLVGYIALFGGLYTNELDVRTIIIMKDRQNANH